MEKLELKHLDFQNNSLVKLSREPHWIFDKVELKNCSLNFNNQVPYIKYKDVSFGLDQIEVYKRPLSDLTQLIEINGKNIIPFLELYKISIDEDVEEYKIVTSSNHPEIYTAGIRVLDSTGEYKILSFSISNGFATQNCGYKDIIKDRVVELTMNQSQLWEKLLEWDFDVFGLIPQGLAIDINTLNQ